MANPRIITTRKATHVLADQTESLVGLAARRHLRTTACGRKVDGMTGHHVAGDFSVSCGNCRRTALYPRLVREVANSVKPEDSDDFPAPGSWGCDDD